MNPISIDQDIQRKYGFTHNFAKVVYDRRYYLFHPSWMTEFQFAKWFSDVIGTRSNTNGSSLYQRFSYKQAADYVIIFTNGIYVNYTRKQKFFSQTNWNRTVTPEIIVKDSRGKILGTKFGIL